jgi:hypothetical protein
MEWESAQMDNHLKMIEKQDPIYNENAVRKAVYQKVLSF